MTTAQLRRLAARAADMEKPNKDKQLEASDLIGIGYGCEDARRIVSLLSDEDVLCWYLNRAKQASCVPVTRVSDQYPSALRLHLGADAPGCLWAKGDLSLLSKPAIALVGSRQLHPDNLAFSEEVGRQAARQGLVLVSGNARGADQAAQNACLNNGGQVICVVADKLEEYLVRENVLYLSEDSFDGAFSAQRALSRNRVIHCLAKQVFVAQATLGKGGTWDGTIKNLRHNWSSVFCFADESKAAKELIQMGAQAVRIEQLENFACLTERETNFF